MSNFEPSKEMLAIKLFISGLPHGAYVSYEDIKKATKIPMNNRGKGYLRSACHSLGIQYQCDRGTGIELESPGNAMHIITTKVKRVASSVKSAHKSGSDLVLHHLEGMNQDDKNRSTAIVSMLGATMAYSKGLEQAYKQQGKLSVVSPPSIGLDPFKK